MSENYGRGKVGRFTNSTHAVPGTSQPEELNNEIHSSTIDNDAFRCRTENRSFKKHDSAVLDAPCMPSKNGGEGSGRKDDNSFLPPKDNNSIVERLNFHNVSDKRKSGNVYVRRRYRKTGSGLKAIDESVVKTGEGKVNAFQKLIETPIKKLEQGFCDGKDVGQSLFSNNTKHTNILSPKNILLPERPPTSIEGQEFYRWSEDNMVSEIIANENKLKHSQFDNDLVMLSKLSAGPGKDLVISRAKLKDLKRTLEVLCVLQKKSPLQSRNNEKLCFFGSCNGQMSGHMAFKNSVMFVDDSGMIVPLFDPRENILNALRERSFHDMDYRFSSTAESKKNKSLQK